MKQQKSSCTSLKKVQNLFIGRETKVTVIPFPALGYNKPVCNWDQEEINKLLVMNKM